MSGNGMRTQDLIFTLFGDYVEHYGNRIWVGSLVRLLALFGISEPVVRSTVSRMVRRGWLSLQRVERTPYYALTAQAQQLLAEGAERIFQPPASSAPWDGCWRMVCYSIPENRREMRDRLRKELGWLGFGMLTNAVWVSPHDHLAQVEALAKVLQVRPYVSLFSGRFDGFRSCRDLAESCWNLTAIEAEYAAFILRHEPALRESERQASGGHPPADAECFRRRFMLTHEYRRFPFRDPYLPAELLPNGWHGAEAVSLFQNYHHRLAAGALRYFESIYR
jgi:phenylacetic acid degradation operon negative regulatory protein